jgi:hypothetical protein
MPNSGFILDEIGHYVKIFDQYDIDISSIAPDNARRMYDQVDIDTLDRKLEEELSLDAEHQFTEWIQKDRAYEAISLIENLNKEFTLEGRISRVRAKAHQKSRPNINLIKTNRDRIVAQLMNVPLNFDAVANRDSDKIPVYNINLYKNNIIDDNDLESQRQSYINDAATYGSGVLKVAFDKILNNPDLGIIGAKIAGGQVLTYEELLILKRSVENHVIEYVDTFEMIRYRGARGEKAGDFSQPMHRWLHRLQEKPVSELRKRYPDVADLIHPATSSHHLTTNPNAYGHYDANDTATLKKSWIKFYVTGMEEVPVENPFTKEVVFADVPVQRYAVAEVHRIENVGVVDINIDKYYHNRPPFIQFNYVESKRHACGIGTVKYGRDPNVIHNMLHSGMLEFIATMSKGGGFIDNRLGLTQEQLSAQRKPGTYVNVNIPEHLQNGRLTDFIVESRPTQFPSIYHDLMGVESRIVDEVMSVPNVSKGIQTGSSGRQEAILQTQADMTHNVSIANMQKSHYPLAIMLFSNIVQFEKDPFVFYQEDPATGEKKMGALNLPMANYFAYDEKTDRYEVKSGETYADVNSVSFKIKIETRSAIPSNPHERANFMYKIFMQNLDLIASPEGRVWARTMNKHGFRVKGIDEALDRIDQIQQQRQQQAGQAEAESRAIEAQQKERESALKEAELGVKLQETLNK